MPDSIEKWSRLLDDSREALLGVVQRAQHGEAALWAPPPGAWWPPDHAAPVDPVAHTRPNAVASTWRASSTSRQMPKWWRL
jgi:hypothetical protein